ncbi:MAG: glycerol-3-phosphate dehydrogenase/oxidase [Planctomycetaceae bacterium]|nr:glycerol-3-phosphate dehydrogenase/oxidase [Planctomycetaceae bacterium]MBL4886513.1 glycerol-3-phosphate dehydrogenase/oxidase [Planctomycetaceae bacterium]
MQRQEMIDAIDSPGEQWDVIIIGGGATGLGAALEASSRGHRTVLLESHDFAKGTSSRSTKLVHGGVRYLRQGRIGMVRQSLLERQRLLNNAPHIVHPLGFVIPSYSAGSGWFYYAGLKAYDLLAGGQDFPKAKMLSREQTLQQLPTLNPHQLRGGVHYSDGQFDDSRLAISLAQTTVEQQGIVLNYSPVTSLIHQGSKLKGVVLQDLESKREISLYSRVVINATGVFADDVLKLDQSSQADSETQAKPVVAPSQGTHIVLDRSFLPSDTAMMIPKTEDGRVLFAIPWHGRTLFGTTDIAVKKIDVEPRPLQEEIEYLLDYAGRYLTKKPMKSDILSMFSGLRPLVRSSSGKSTSQLSREHDIRTSSSGLISIIGGKWTTYRRMGEELINLAERVGGLDRRNSRTADLPLHGSPKTDQAEESETCEEALKVYGSDIEGIRKLSSQDPSLNKQLHPRLPYLASEVVWAARCEMARTVEDVLARRTRALFLDANAAIESAPQVASLLMQELQQNQGWRDSQIKTFEALAKGYCNQD